MKLVSVEVFSNHSNSYISNVVFKGLLFISAIKETLPLIKINQMTGFSM